MNYEGTSTSDKQLIFSHVSNLNFNINTKIFLYFVFEGGHTADIGL
jgi:hypothetical protein